MYWNDVNARRFSDIEGSLGQERAGVKSEGEFEDILKNSGFIKYEGTGRWQFSAINDFSENDAINYVSELCTIIRWYHRWPDLLE